MYYRLLYGNINLRYKVKHDAGVKEKKQLNAIGFKYSFSSEIEIYGLLPKSLELKYYPQTRGYKQTYFFLARYILEDRSFSSFYSIGELFV